jgi:hypothetical protein
MFEFADATGNKFQACDAIASCLNQNDASDSSIIEFVVVAPGEGSTSGGVTESGVVEIASAPVSVPGPIAGAGLPGLMFAGCGLLGWWRRKRRAQAAATAGRS